MGEKGIVAIRPQWCLIDEQKPICRGKIVDIVFYGLCQEVTVDVQQGQDLVVHLHRHEHVDLGEEVGLNFDPPPLGLLGKY